MLRHYVVDDQQKREEYLPAFAHAYNRSINSSSGTTLFDLVLPRSPPTFGTEGSQLEPSSSMSWSKQDYLEILEASISRAKLASAETPREVKKDFQEKVSTFPNKNLKGGNLVSLDVRERRRRKSCWGGAGINKISRPWALSWLSEITATHSNCREQDTRMRHVWQSQTCYRQGRPSECPWSWYR